MSQETNITAFVVEEVISESEVIASKFDTDTNEVIPDSKIRVVDPLGGCLFDIPESGVVGLRGYAVLIDSDESDAPCWECISICMDAVPA